MQYPDISRYVSKARKAEVVIGIDPDCDKSGFAKGGMLTYQV